MNLFRIHIDPEQNARGYPDKYTYNQVRESEQFLRYALYLNHGFEYPGYPISESNSHLHHPMTKWAAESQANWMQTLTLTEASHTEWIRRYNHPEDRLHKSMARIRAMVPESRNLPNSPGTLQPCPFDDKFKPHPTPTTLDEVVENYRNYIRKDKRHKSWFKYVKTTPPQYMDPYLK